MLIAIKDMKAVVRQNTMGKWMLWIVRHNVSIQCGYYLCRILMIRHNEENDTRLTRA